MFKPSTDQAWHGLTDLTESGNHMTTYFSVISDHYGDHQYTRQAASKQ